MMNKGRLKSLLAKREKNRRYNRSYIQRWVLIFIRNHLLLIFLSYIFPIWWYVPDLITQQDYILCNLVILFPLCSPMIFLLCMMLHLLKKTNPDIDKFELTTITHNLISLFITIQLTKIKFDGYTTNYSAVIFERQWVLVSLIYVCVYCMFRSVIGAPSRYVDIKEEENIF